MKLDVKLGQELESVIDNARDIVYKEKKEVEFEHNGIVFTLSPKGSKPTCVFESRVGKTVSVYFAQKTRVVKFIEVSQFGYIFEILEDDHNYVKGQLIFFNHSTPLEINLL